MSGPLLPSLQAGDLRRALTDYLTTTFALTDDDVRAALTTFLTDSGSGIFRGPYVRLRLPFRPADGTWTVPLDWWPEDFTPHVHQAQAFERLSSKYGSPQPTLVTTGTGSGKTEAFLVPMIDHVLRVRSMGQRGLKCLVLYPMNALANDQAARLTRILTTNPRLAGITAGIYTGEQQGQRTQVSSGGLITSREVMRSDPPDILLTNYKMLDQLLLRGNDRGLWEGAADSLTYICLDEFHTYDGAQGTDVAMLLRRLGSAIGVARPDAPLGDVVPIATSATLGGGTTSSLEAMRNFAATVFGRPFDPDVIIREERLTSREWIVEHARPVAGVTQRALGNPALLAAAVREEAPKGPEAAAIGLLGALYAPSANNEDAPDELTASDLRRLRRPGLLPALLAGHPYVQQMLDAADRPIAIRDLAAAILPDDTNADRADGVTVIEALLGLLSLARAEADGAEARQLLGIDVQLWVREVSRIDRQVATATSFRWADDGSHSDSELFLPSLYCRHCGRAGWGALRTVTGRAVDSSQNAIRRAAAGGDQRFRAMLHAPGEATAYAGEDVKVDGLLWLDTNSLELTSEPGDRIADQDETGLVPVLTWWDDDKAARAQTCPSCRQPDGIRFLGSGVATLTSVTLSALFGAAHLDPAEKKTLLFTDSVQDAAYTAGFVQARSHALSLRAALLDTIIAAGPLSLEDIAREAVQRAADDPIRRYRLVPPALSDWQNFRRYWEPSGSQQDRLKTRRLVEQRLAFDAILEFGLNARTGRTLELTGSVVADVDIGSSETVLRAARRAISRAREQHSLSPDTEAVLGAELDDPRLLGWVRGVLERMRTRGGIKHAWLDPYLDRDGNRWLLTGGRGRARDQGLPSFPPGRSAPAFPTTGTKTDTLDSLTGTASWYARWAQRQLLVTPRDGGLVTRALLEECAAAGWLVTRRTETTATVFALDPARVVVAAADPAGLAGGLLALRCNVCHTLTPGGYRTVSDLFQAACLRQGCPGTLHRAERGEDYYRQLYASSDMRRVVAHEHTSLLPDKVRLAVEDAFRDGVGPAVPNVLAATPTLELGIDIGDLSTVMLGSLPRSVASYVQRVGRAGRLTGNALILAFVRGRGQNVHRLAAPLSVIDGDVRPPATYLDAIEILQRQYIGWLLDRRAAAGATDPGTAAGLFPSDAGEPGSWMGSMLADTSGRAEEDSQTFLALFGDRVRPDTAQHLQEWAGAGVPEGSLSGLALLLQRAAVGYRREVEDLAHRRTDVQDRLPDLKAAAARPTATAEDHLAARMAESELRYLTRRRSAVETQFWVNALEERGVLPNYSLLDDRVTLDVSLRWVDQDTGNYQEEPRSYHRGSAAALTEWAPGATFYAQAAAVRIDAVDVGSDLDGLLQTWRICPTCGWSRLHRDSEGPETHIPATCPRCGDPGVADTGQAISVLPLEKVSAQIDRDAAAIGDARDERDRRQFSVVPAADIDPDHVSDAWQLSGYPFGAEYIQQVEIRWLNVGRSGEQAADRRLAGWDVRTPMFEVCPGCGVVPAAQPGVRDLQDTRHRAWCPHRTAIDVDFRRIALGRTLRTQGVRVLVPPQFTLDEFAVPSLRAALLLGLRELLGGSPDHLDVLQVNMAVDGQPRTALLLHDRVPGGTGYLADLARPDRVHQLLTSALTVLRNCTCAAENLLACHECLLPFTPPWMVERTSRVRAEHILADVLSAGTGDESGAEWKPEQLRSVADIPAPTLESALELRFRLAFAAALRDRGVAVQEIPQLAGTELRLGVPGMTYRRWTLRPQIPVAGCKPDFELLCQDPTIPRVFIFTDGRTWHASPANNRIADDATKRAAVRAAGHQVWAVTDDDVRTFEAKARGEAATPTGAAWYTPHIRDRLVRIRASVIPAGSISDEIAVADAVTQLVSWVMDPRPVAWQQLADGLPLALMQGSPPARRDVDRGALPAMAAHAITDTSPVPAGTAPGDLQAWVWTQPAWSLAAAGRARAPFDVGAVVVVDDRDASLTTDDGIEAWRCWLALSNLLGHATRVAQPMALSQTSTASLPARVQPEASHSVLPEAWTALIKSAADDLEVELLRALAAGGSPLPEQGHETDAGIPIDLAWPDPRIAVLISRDPDAVAELTEDGWQVIDPDPQLLLALLAPRGAE